MELGGLENCCSTLELGQIRYEDIKRMSPTSFNDWIKEEIEDRDEEEQISNILYFTRFNGNEIRTLNKHGFKCIGKYKNPGGKEIKIMQKIINQN